MSFPDNNRWNVIRNRRSWSIGHETEEHLISNFKTPGFVRIEGFFLFFFFFKLWDPLWGSRYTQSSWVKDLWDLWFTQLKKRKPKTLSFSCCFKLSVFWESGTLKKKYPLWVCFLFLLLGLHLKNWCKIHITKVKHFNVHNSVTFSTFTGLRK